MKVAIYTRVSTRDKGQDPENQVRALKAWIHENGHELAATYTEHESGAKGESERPQLARMFRDAERRRFDLVLFWSLDRLSREGIAKTVTYLQRLQALGIKYRSHTQPFLDSSNELVAHILVGVISYFAQLEREMIAERTRAGLDRARERGAVLGRPRERDEHAEAILALAEDGDMSQRAIAQALGVSRGMVRRVLADHEHQHHQHA